MGLNSLTIRPEHVDLSGIFCRSMPIGPTKVNSCVMVMDSNDALLNIGLSNQTKRLEILVSLLRITSWFCVKAKMELPVSHATLMTVGLRGCLKSREWGEELLSFSSLGIWK